MAKAKRTRRVSVTKGLGEPTLDSTTTIGLVNALNWYNYNSEPNDYKTWLKDFLTAVNFDKKVASKVLHYSKSFPQTWAAIARLESRGFSTGRRQELVDFINQFIQSKEDAVYEDDDGESATQHKTVTIRERLEAACTPLLTWIDQQVDNFISGEPYNDNFYSYLSEQGCGAAHARVIRADYQHQFDEIRLLADGDPNVVECYEIYGKKGQKLLIKIFEKLENDLLQFEQAKKAQRVKKVRKPSADRVVKHVKYCQESDEFKIGSIQPIKVLGSDHLWVFNTKTRQLGCYVGSNLSFKRSAVTNYDIEQSVCKTLRKPEEVLKAISSGSRTKCMKLFESIKAKSKPMNGRINQFTVLVKVF